MLELKIAETQYIPQILAFHKELNNYYLSIGEKYLVSDKTDKDITKKINDYCLALCDGEVVGVVCATTKNNVVTLSQFFVKPKYRQLGVGTKLFNFALDQAKKNGAKSARLVVKNGNTRAIDMYSRWGFRSGAQIMYLDF